MVTTICRARAIQSHPAQEGIKLVGRTTIGRQLGHLERASTAVWVVKKGVNRALPRRHIISGGYCTDRALSDSTRHLFDVGEAMKTFQHALCTESCTEVLLYFAAVLTIRGQLTSIDIYG